MRLSHGVKILNETGVFQLEFISTLIQPVEPFLNTFAGDFPGDRHIFRIRILVFGQLSDCLANVVHCVVELHVAIFVGEQIAKADDGFEAFFRIRRWGKSVAAADA